MKRATITQQIGTGGVAARCLLRKGEKAWILASPEGVLP